MDPTLISSAADTLTAAPEWQAADDAGKSALIRAYAIGQRAANQDPTAHAALVQELWKRREPGMLRAGAEFVGNATKEVLASVPAAGTAIVMGASDAIGNTDTGSGGRFKQGLNTLADGTVQRLKSLDPNDLQEHRDAGLDFLKQDIDARTYPEGVEAWMAGEVPEDKLDPAAKKYVNTITEGFATAAVRADHGADATADRYAAYKQSGRYLNNMAGDVGPPAREFLADYMATGDPASWEAFTAKVKQTDAQWKAELQNAPKKSEARTIAANNPGVMSDLAVRGMEMQGSPIDLATMALPFLKGAKALSAARAGATGSALKEAAKGALMEGVQEGLTTTLQDPNASNAQIAMDAASGAVGGTVITGGATAIGAGIRRLAPASNPATTPSIAGTTPTMANPATVAPAPLQVPPATAAPAANDPTLPNAPAGPAAAPLIESPPEPGLTLSDVAARAGTVDNVPPPLAPEEIQAENEAGPDASLFPMDDDTDLAADLPAASLPPPPPPIYTTPPTELDPVGTIAETPDTLREQLARVAAGTQPAMTVPGATVDQLPADLRPKPESGLVAIDTAAGVAIAPQASAPAVAKAAEENRLGEALGYGVPDRPASPTAAVVLRDPDGVEIQAAEVDNATLPTVQTALHNRAQPGDTVTVEPMAEVAQRRAARRPRPATTNASGRTPMPRPSARARIVSLWREIAREVTPDYGWTDNPDLGEIAAAVSKPDSPVTLTAQGNSIIVNSRSGPLTIYNANGPSPFIYSAGMNSSGRTGQRSSGSQAYLAAFLWARNNGKTISSSGLTEINRTRRTSNMVSMALRRLAAGDPDFTSHTTPAPEQGLRSRGTPEDKLVEMLLKEHDHVSANVPELNDLTYDRAARQFSYQGNPIDNAALAGFRRNGVGPASIRRAVITRWLLDHPVRASRSGSGSQTGSGETPGGRRVYVGLENLLYSRQESAGNPGTPLAQISSNPAKVAAEAVEAINKALPGLVSERVHFLSNPASLTASGYAPEGYFTAEEMEAMQGAEGFHDPRTGRTIIFTDQVIRRPGESPRSAVARVLIHERVGHDGVNHLLATSPAFAVRWEALAARIPQAELDAIAQTEGYGHLTNDRPQLALEWLAQQADQIETARAGLKGLPAQLWETLKAFLASAYSRFSRTPIAANEVRQLLDRARQAALSGTAIPTSAEALQFSLGGTAIRHRAGTPFRVNNLTWRTILTGSPLPKAMVETVRNTERARKAADQASAQLGRDLQTAAESVAQRTGMPLASVHQHLNDYMDGTPGSAATLQALDPVLTERARRARNMLDDLSNAIASSLPTGTLRDGILANIGTWMRRSYAAFDPASGWNYDALDAAAKAGTPINGVDAARVMREARNFLRAQTPGLTPAELEADMRDLMDRNQIAHAFAGTSQVRANVSSLMARQDIPAEIRALMGEETNAVHRFAQSSKFQTQFLQRHEGQRALRQIGLANGLFQNTRGGVFVEQIPGTAAGDNQRWAPLSGIWTTPQLAQALRDNEGGMQSGTDLGGYFVEALKWAGNTAKLNKVALNPDSWVVNALGNVVSVVAGGDVFYGNISRRISQAVAIYRSGKARPTDVYNATAEAIADAHRAMAARLTSSGVLGESFTLRDLESTIPRQLLQWVATDLTRERGLGAAQGAIMGQAALRGLGVTGRLAGAAVGGALGAKAGYNTIQGWQQKVADYVMTGPDALGRLTGFMGNLEAAHASGLTGNAAFDWAAERTRNTFPDYGKLPAVFKQLSRLGVTGSFIGFQYEVYRNYIWNIRYAAQEIRSQNPALQRRGVARMIGVAAVGGLAAGGLSALLGLATGTPSDDERNQRFRRWFAAPWEKNGNLNFTRYDKQGVTYFNTSYLLPQSTIMELANAARSGEDPVDGAGRVVSAVWEQFAGGSVNLDPILAAATNKDRIGRPITTKTGLPGAMERADYAGQVILEPGWAQKLTRITYALREAQRNGRTFTLEEEGKRLIGIRSFSRNWDQLIERRFKEFGREFDNILAEGNRTLSENVPGAREKAVQQTNSAMQELQAKLQQFDQDLQRDKLPAVTINTARRDARVPRPRPVIPNPQNPTRLMPVR